LKGSDSDEEVTTASDVPSADTDTTERNDVPDDLASDAPVELVEDLEDLPRRYGLPTCPST